MANRAALKANLLMKCMLRLESCSSSEPASGFKQHAAKLINPSLIYELSKNGQSKL